MVTSRSNPVRNRARDWFWFRRSVYAGPASHRTRTPATTLPSPNTLFDGVLKKLRIFFPKESGAEVQSRSEKRAQRGTATLEWCTSANITKGARIQPSPIFEGSKKFSISYPAFASRPWFARKSTIIIQHYARTHAGEKRRRFIAIYRRVNDVQTDQSALRYKSVGKNF